MRDDLLKFLRKDSEERGATILCRFCIAHCGVESEAALFPDATHIFDGLSEFPTHVAHMRLGSFVTPRTAWPMEAIHTGVNTQLYTLALNWLREDRAYRQNLERDGRKLRGARKDDVCVCFIKV